MSRSELRMLFTVFIPLHSPCYKKCLIFRMKYFCYILFSQKLNKYYIGETNDPQQRLQYHNEGHFTGSYTSKSDDWEIFLSIECSSRIQARRIEKHIKRMKSRIYIQNLKIYPDIITKLLNKYTN